MEPATCSAITINKILLNFNGQIAFNLTVYAFFITAAATSASKVIILLVQKILEVLHQRWLMRFQDKRNLALEIIKICNEGSTTGWNIKPRDMEHVYYIARLIEEKNKEASELFDTCISSWSLNAIRQECSEATKENIEFCQELQKRAQIACEKLLKIVHKWLQ